MLPEGSNTTRMPNPHYKITWRDGNIDCNQQPYPLKIMPNTKGPRKQHIHLSQETCRSQAPVNSQPTPPAPLVTITLSLHEGCRPTWPHDHARAENYIPHATEDGDGDGAAHNEEVSDTKVDDTQQQTLGNRSNGVTTLGQRALAVNSSRKNNARAKL